MFKGILIGVLSMFAAAGLAGAKPKFPTKYTYYTVTGLNAIDVFKSLSRRGPTVRGILAYATTLAQTRQTGQLIQKGKSCRLKNFSFQADFVINLPKLRDEAKLTGVSRQNWRAFSSFLRQHEEQHRAIWMQCGRELQQSATRVNFGDCQSAERAADKMFTAVQASCQKRHQALDTRDQRALRRHPFIRQVLRDVQVASN
jgi:predicted secreted Zn-dependent protease